MSAAFAATTSPITQAYLVRPRHPPLGRITPPIELVVLDRLRRLYGGSPLHLSLAGVVRRWYILFRKDIGRRNKEPIRAATEAAG